MVTRVGTAASKIVLLLITVLFYCVFNDVKGQRQFEIRQMRDDMSRKLETYSFGFSWDNEMAFDSLNDTFTNYSKLLSNRFLWKNRQGNSTERNFFRLLTNFGISAIDDQNQKDQLLNILLEYDPYLIPDNSDNIPDLADQLKRFYPLPSLKGGIKIGFNLNSTLPQGQGFQVVQSTSTSKKYGIALGWQVAFPITYLFARNHSVSLEPGISYSNMEVTESILGSTQTYSYRVYYSDIPLVYRLSLLNPRLSGFRNIRNYNEGRMVKIDKEIKGIENKIENSKIGRSSKLERKINEKISRRDHLEMNTPFRRVIPSLIVGFKPKIRINSFIDSDNANSLTNWIQLDAIAGIGLDWYRQRNTYGIELRYNFGLIDFNTEERYYVGGETTGLLFNNFYVSDNFRIQIFEISFIANYILSHRSFKVK